MKKQSKNEPEGGIPLRPSDFEGRSRTKKSPKWESNPRSYSYQEYVLPLNYLGIRLYLPTEVLDLSERRRATKLSGLYNSKF